MDHDILYPHPWFVDSGCAPLNLALSGRVNGGWRRGRVNNIAGLPSTGKTQLAVEACCAALANNPQERARYFDVEQTIDLNLYHKMFGEEVVNRLTLVQATPYIEDFVVSVMQDMHDIEVVDSLDMMRSETAAVKWHENLNRRAKGQKEKGSFGVDRARKLSEDLPYLVEAIAHEKKLAVADQTDEEAGGGRGLLLFVSQVRQNINPYGIGPKYIQAGGMAFQFDCSQIVWLRQVKELSQTLHSTKYTTAIVVEARVKKNKVSYPGIAVQFPLRLDHGVDNEVTIINWLVENQVLAPKTKGSKFLVMTDGSLDLEAEFDQLAELLVGDMDLRAGLLTAMQKKWDENIEAVLGASPRRKFWREHAKA